MLNPVQQDIENRDELVGVHLVLCGQLCVGCVISYCYQQLLDPLNLCPCFRYICVDPLQAVADAFDGQLDVLNLSCEDTGDHNPSCHYTPTG